MKTPNSINRSQEMRFSKLNSTFSKSHKNLNNLDTNSKNFLLDYVFKSDKLTALKKTIQKPKFAESYTNTESSFNSKYAKNSKIFKGNLQTTRTQKNVYFSSTEANSNQEKINIKSKIIQKLSYKDKPVNFKFPNVNPTNLKYQFFDLANKIRENKLKQTKDDSSSQHISDLNEKLTYNVCKSYSIKSRHEEEYTNSNNMPNVKNIVLNSSRINQKEVIISPESYEIPRNTENINFYQVNIGKYMNISKDSSQSFLQNSLNSPISNKFGNKKVAHNQLKPSFSRLINMENLENPEELHYTSVLFNLEKNKLAPKFDRSHSVKLCYKNESDTAFLIEEIDI
jgi:hypothetical protein